VSKFKTFLGMHLTPLCGLARCHAEMTRCHFWILIMRVVVAPQSSQV
jgi:hypothetical protein